MRVFILRARRMPTAAESLEKHLGGYSHFEIIAHTLISALFVSRDVRSNVLVYVVCEGPPDPPRVIGFDSRALFMLPGFDERAILSIFERALRESEHLGREQTRQIDDGLTVGRTSFEHLVRSLGARQGVYVLDRRGQDIREVAFPEECCFILTDHMPMQKNVG